MASRTDVVLWAACLWTIAIALGTLVLLASTFDGIVGVWRNLDAIALYLSTVV